MSDDAGRGRECGSQSEQAAAVLARSELLIAPDLIIAEVSSIILRTIVFIWL